MTPIGHRRHTLFDSKGGDPSQPFVDAYGNFTPGKICPEAKMRTIATCYVAVVLPRQVDRVGAHEFRGVAVSNHRCAGNEVSLTHGHSFKVHVFGSHADNLNG